MVPPDKRRAVFDFKAKGWGSRRISKAVGLARSTVQEILKEEPGPRPESPRPRKLMTSWTGFVSCTTSAIDYGVNLRLVRLGC